MSAIHTVDGGRITFYSTEPGVLYMNVTPDNGPVSTVELDPETVVGEFRFALESAAAEATVQR